MGYILPCFRALTIWGFSICFTWKLCWPAVWAASCATFDLGNETSTSSPFLLLFHLYCFWPFKWRKIHWIKKLCMCIYVHLDPKTKKKEIGHTICSYNIFLRFGVLDILCQFWKLFSRPIGCKMLFQTIFFKLLQWIIFTHYCSEQFFAPFCKYLFQTIFLGKLLSWIIFLQIVVVSEWLASFEDYLSSHRYSKLFFWTIFCKLLLWTIFLHIL